MAKLTKWTVSSISDHIKYLENINTKKPENIKQTITYWKHQLDRIKLLSPSAK